MIDGLSSYPDYKDSGLPWLGEIPVSWEVRRNGRLFQQRNETGFPDLPILEVSLRTGVRIRDFDNSNRKQVMSDRDKYKRAGKGDIAYNMMRMWQGAVGVAPEDGLISPAYIVAKPLPDTDARYFEYLFRTCSYMDEVNKFSCGIVSDRNRLYWEDFKQMPSPVPPPDEQAAIVRFLDHADRRIRRYIRAKRKLIELLNEQRQALIHQAVTRGLDPHVKLKPSGVEWLGDVPEHWEVSRLGRISEMRVSNVDKHTKEDENPVRLCNYVDVYKNDVIASQMDFMQATATVEEIERNRLQVGDVVITKDSESSVDIGVPALVTSTADDLVCGYHLAVLRPFQGTIEGEYLYWCMRSMGVAWQFHVAATGVTRFGLSHAAIKTAAIALPNADEQCEISSFLTSSCKGIDKAISQALAEIELLREYQKRLIADVVTGKLDVREAAAQLDGQVIEKPSKRRSAKEPNKHFYRSVLAAEIVERHQGERKFGRIKLQKALVLAEYHLQLTEIQSDLKRAAAGPFDNKMMRSIESQLKKQKWFDSVATEGKGTQIEYRPLEKRGGHQTYFDRYWSSKQADFDRLMSLVKPMRTVQAEIVATLYFAWNDFLIDGEQFDDDRLVDEVLTNWHPKKERITRDRWHKAIQWMRENKLVPTGFGAHTQRKGVEA